MTARTCTIKTNFSIGLVAMRDGRAIYFIGAAVAEFQERDSKEPGFSHTAGAVSRTIAVNWRNPFACIASDIHWSVDCYQNGIFYNTIARQ